ncbi:MAG: carbohydrate ABC transporter permease [Deltaproteobacteria bacterium]|nr:carbohydrate ABC transporter permease [Deltaproteobacteria bacterium]
MKAYPAASSRSPRRARAFGRPARARVAALCVYLLLLIGSAAMLMPLLWLVRSSFMGLSQIFIFPPEWIPDPWRWDNYPTALTTIPFVRYFFNTLFILVPTVAGTLLTATLAAYGFSRLQWPGRDWVFGILLSALMLPYAVTLIPTFLLWAEFGLINTYWPLVLPDWFGGSIFYIFLLRQFFLTLPRELDEAAIIDGANPLQVLRHVIVPLSRPALITVGIFSSLFEWNDFLGPLIYLNDSRRFTLALGLAEFTGIYTSQWHLLMAAATVVIAPVLILFLFAQRYFIEGIALTGIKA